MNFSHLELKKIFKERRVQLAFVIVISFLLRLYRVDNPVLDWHAFRQADTASVTYRYTLEGVNLLYPKYHDLSNIQSGLDNPEGYRMVEFPLINGFIAIILRALPEADLVITSRFISILASTGTMIFLYWFIKQILSHQLALLSVIFFGLMPFSIFYSRVILPEPFMLMFSTASMAFFAAYYLPKNLKDRKKVFWWLSIICLALSLLIKPFVLFLAPVYVYILWLHQPHFLKNMRTYLYPILAIIPLILWRRWIQNFPEGIPASQWLFNSDGIRLRPAWFRWLFWERLTILIGGFIGPILALPNILKKNKGLMLLASWWTGLILYLIVIATGNVRHDYYQVLLIPCVALTFARGVQILQQILFNKLESKRISFSQQISWATISLLTLTMILLSWNQVKGYFNVNHWEYLHAGEEVRQLIEADAKIIAPAMGDTMFLFQTRRNGWPIGYNIKDKIEAGATHYVSTTYDDEARELESKYLTVKKTNEFILIDLTKSRPQ
ncbi:MAG: PMT family glycosyltransferase, 4-amino-4-deoxy-L-arabinose transferase [Microgenomates bacterium 39_7]|nr:MAG: PMT family glycosyltransferase, 4-amino-4-deoxy-L-arabinose transferase [Microgenomates bacterium 39_7]